MNKYFEKIYTQNKDFVFRTAYGLLRNVEDAEDVVIEVFCKLYIYLKTNREIRNIPAWLRTVARTTAIDMIRKFGKESPILRENRFQQGDHFREVTNKIFVSEILNDLYRKNPVWLEYIEMRYLLEMTYDEIAAATSSTVPAVKNSVARAKKYLAGKYGSDHGDLLWVVVAIMLLASIDGTFRNDMLI